MRGGGGGMEALSCLILDPIRTIRRIVHVFAHVMVASGSGSMAGLACQKQDCSCSSSGLADAKAVMAHVHEHMKATCLISTLMHGRRG